MRWCSLGIVMVVAVLSSTCSSEGTPQPSPSPSASNDATGNAAPPAEPAKQPEPVRQPEPVEQGAPVKPPEPAKPPADPFAEDVKALGLKDGPMSVEDGMHLLQDGKLEELLEAWAQGGTPDFAVVKKSALLTATVADRIDWKTNKKREKDPAAHDKLATEWRDAARALVTGAAASDAAQVKTHSDKILQHCTDCHVLYR